MPPRREPSRKRAARRPRRRTTSAPSRRRPAAGLPESGQPGVRPRVEPDGRPPRRPPRPWRPARRRGAAGRRRRRAAGRRRPPPRRSGPAWVTTTSAPPGRTTGPGEGGARAAPPSPSPGVAARAAASCREVPPAAPAPQQQRPGPTGRVRRGAGRSRPSKRESAPTRPGFSRQRSGHAGVRLLGPRGEQGVGEVVGQAWGRSVRPPGIAATTTGTPQRPREQGDLDGHVDHDERGSGVRRATRRPRPLRRARPASCRGAQCRAPRAVTSTGARGLVVVALELHPLAPDAAGRGRELSPSPVTWCCARRSPAGAVRWPAPWWWT